MTFPNWYNIEQVARDRARECSVSNAISLVSQEKHYPRASASLSKGRLLLAISIVALLSATALYSSGLGASSNSGPLASPRSPVPAPLVTSSSSPTVIVIPGYVPLGTLGTTFTVQIQVQNMDQFNGWDIQVRSYSEIINATSLSITGNDFMVNASSGTPIEIEHCVNGKGTGCTSADGQGTVHSAYVNSGVLTGNGLLFAITYQVMTPLPYSYIQLYKDLISSPSLPNGVPHVSISGYYGATLNPPGPGGGSGGTHHSLNT